MEEGPRSAEKHEHRPHRNFTHHNTPNIKDTTTMETKQLKPHQQIINTTIKQKYKI
ncbi:MAG: hypothetical protein ACUVT5_06790 [Candidatus Bathyarchaeales archaeon]